MSCIFCGSQDATEKIVFKDTFTAYQLLQAGDRACGRCASMLGDAKYRRNCWFMKGTEWRKIDDVLGFLANMPEPPFVLYLTLQKRKHGWILAVQNPVLSVNRFVLVVDESKIFFDRQRFTEHLTFLESLWLRKVPKGVMSGGYPSAGLIRKFGFSRLECQRLERLQSDRLWLFAVAFKHNPKLEENKNE